MVDKALGTGGRKSRRASVAAEKGESDEPLKAAE